LGGIATLRVGDTQADDHRRGTGVDGESHHLRTTLMVIFGCLRRSCHRWPNSATITAPTVASDVITDTPTRIQSVTSRVIFTSNAPITRRALSIGQTDRRESRHSRRDRRRELRDRLPRLIERDALHGRR
jgi:hypothetical protein